ncbi:hypothetical protein WAF17_20595 [Bernardetia sp. ABR2-2B]|uniref:hypothetical protein n=1 Tax=Bernardetia sp. ABR2-2B TaxID=3127472 RepID=UPI0030D28FEF
MLEKLDTIPWSELKHAYGSAANIPNDLHNLASSDEKTCDQALSGLYGNIFHQGTRYTATPYAIPFLFELIENETTHNRAELIYYIINLALGYEEAYLVEGINPAQIKAELKEAHKTMSLEEIKDSKEYGYSYLALLDCYSFVEERIPILWEIIEKTPKSFNNEVENNKNRKLINSAIYASAWFAEKGTTSIELIKRQIPVLTHENDIANCILAIGLLSKNTEPKIDISFLEAYLDSTSVLLKTSAAIALIKYPLTNQIIEILIDSITSNEELRKINEIPFNDGNINGYASGMLSGYAQTQEEEQRILLAFCQVLEKLNMYQATETTGFVLDILNRNRTIPIKETDVNNLEKNEIIALRAIANSKGWGEGDMSFANFSLMMRDAGLPSEKEELIEYLGEYY